MQYTCTCQCAGFLRTKCIIIEITTYFKSSSDLFSFSALAKEMAPVEVIFMFDKLQLKGNISTLNQLYCLQQHCFFVLCNKAVD